MPQLFFLFVFLLFGPHAASGPATQQKPTSTSVSSQSGSATGQGEDPGGPVGGGQCDPTTGPCGE